MGGTDLTAYTAVANIVELWAFDRLLGTLGERIENYTPLSDIYCRVCKEIIQENLKTNG